MRTKGSRRLQPAYIKRNLKVAATISENKEKGGIPNERTNLNYRR